MTRDFRARRKQLHVARVAKYAVNGLMPFTAFDDRAFDTTPKVGDRWGLWRYENDGRRWERRLIFNGCYGVEARYRTALDAFKVILHVSKKRWATPEVVGTMIQAIMDINPHLESLCYSGATKKEAA